MAEVYASSPAKRRKMCVDDVDASEALMPAADASCNSKAAPSRLKGYNAKTPTKLQQKSSSSKPEPQTPGNKQQKSSGSSAEDALLNLSPQMLAPNLMLLNQLLGALYVTLPMVKSRGRATTYHNMRVPVQNFCGRDFQVQHMQQIKALLPEAFGWEHILALNPTTRRQEQQLCLSMPTDPSNPKQLADTAHMQQLFFQRLQQHQACAGPKVAELELPLAELPPPSAPSTRDCTPSRQRVSSLLPSTPQTAPPAAGSMAQQMLSPPPKRLATAVRAPAASELMSPPPTRTRAGNRRLVMDVDKAAAGGEGSFTFSPAARQPDMLLSPRGAASSFRGRRSNLMSTPERPDSTAAAAAAAQDSSSMTPNLRPNRLFDTPVAAATPQQSSAARPNTHATPEAAVEEAAAGGRAGAAAAGVKVRKLTFDLAAPSAAAAAAAAKSNLQKGPGVASAKSAASNSSSGSGHISTSTEAPKARVGGIKFELGESTMALLRQVSSAEVKQEAAIKHEQLEQQRALHMLPGSFEVLRAVFGERGPCVKPKAEVLQLLRQKSTSKSGMSAADAGEQLELVLRLVPEFVRVVTASGGASLAGLTQSVRINRQLSWPEARKKLLAGAAEARSTGSSAAAQAVAAEQQREAAAAAAAVELDDEELSGSETEDELVAAAEAAAVAAGAVDELGLDIVAELDNTRGGGGGGRGGHSKQAAAALDDELLALLGGGSSSGSTKAGKGSAMPAAMLGALACKAPSAGKKKARGVK